MGARRGVTRCLHAGMIAMLTSGIVLDVQAFGAMRHGGPSLAHGSTARRGTTIRSNRRSPFPLSLSSLQDRDQGQEQWQQQHPHSVVWSITLAETSPNSYLHPSIELAIRPPSEGGTGIVATDDLDADTVAMCLPLGEVGMINAASVLDSYDEGEGRDEVLSALKETWTNELVATDKQKNEEGKRLSVLAGVLAHLQLTRYRDLTSWAPESVGACALEHSRRLGPFLDAMPLLPRRGGGRHPFPTHFLYWTEDEVEVLLRGTMGQTRAREVRAGIGLVVREWSYSFVKEHSGGASREQILDAIFSAFTAVLSRSFGDAAGRDVDGKGRMLVPLVDMLNHDGEDPNVSWTWHVGESDESDITDEKGDIAVTTLRTVKKGEELVKCYGWRPAWDIASSYGFVPILKRERWECSVIPLFPAVLDLIPGSVPTPIQKAGGETTLDLLLEANYGPLVKAVIMAVDAAAEAKARREGAGVGDDGGESSDNADDGRPSQLNRLEVVSLFRMLPESTAGEFPFPRRQPCAVVGTTIRSSDAVGEGRRDHQRTIESILPAFRAAASAVFQLQNNRQESTDDDASPVKTSQMALAAASLDRKTDWDARALELIQDGIADRLQALVDYGAAAEAWLAKQNDAYGNGDPKREHQRCRAELARDVRGAELSVLRALQETVMDW